MKNIAELWKLPGAWNCLDSWGGWESDSDLESQACLRGREHSPEICMRGNKAGLCLDTNMISILYVKGREMRYML